MKISHISSPHLAHLYMCTYIPVLTGTHMHTRIQTYIPYMSTHTQTCIKMHSFDGGFHPELVYLWYRDVCLYLIFGSWRILGPSGPIFAFNTVELSQIITSSPINVVMASTNEQNMFGEKWNKQTCCCLESVSTFLISNPED